ncbi:uncharacterized protein PGTG_10912 [Puccinia graminis f. sp. tritici CRL 75-36-700-3]|uniref:Uncharacterized protein n=1 Tax=Puccinia graminis f. sp. tritici (strain CRL 75-36-700-3 / race SCCL) TaxID=418459 RepID=E3KKC8_PUCGT|nr:uncharacterized protein PGTG_10912 [Puccinia graminis f. sp. tritici CRL 75-36-700-3]EFP84753.1 hypothetical protein PGTG_10912 [Puccinia graminis f. sp. tritici CRL 75-36-700-3]
MSARIAHEHDLKPPPSPYMSPQSSFLSIIPTPFPSVQKFSHLKLPPFAPRSFKSDPSPTMTSIHASIPLAMTRLISASQYTFTLLYSPPPIRSRIAVRESGEQLRYSIPALQVIE